MALGLKWIEKEFVLGAARDEKIPVLLAAGGGEWPLQLLSFSQDGLLFSHQIPARLLSEGKRYDFRFDYREQEMTFSSVLVDITDTKLSFQMPESIFKGLERRYRRRAPPSDLSVSFSLEGDRYELAFPKTREYAPVSGPEVSDSFKGEDIRDLIRQFNSRAGEFADRKAIVMFKEKKPETLEEKLITATGRVLYIPTALSGLPSIDPYVEPRIITRDIFRDYVRRAGLPAQEGARPPSSGAMPASEEVDEALTAFERMERRKGLVSALYIPIVFQEYVIGYVMLSNSDQKRPPFDLSVLDTFYQFAKVLAYSLKTNGYFAAAPKKKSDFSADVIDVSAGGLLFTSASRALAAALLPGSGVELSITKGPRIMRAQGLIRRRYQDANLYYYALEYREIAPEDFRFLFEELYGRPYTDADSDKVGGSLIRPRPQDGAQGSA